jgi:hypothetical protein
MPSSSRSTGSRSSALSNEPDPYTLNHYPVKFQVKIGHQLHNARQLAKHAKQTGVYKNMYRQPLSPSMVASIKKKLGYVQHPTHRSQLVTKTTAAKARKDAKKASLRATKYLIQYLLNERDVIEEREVKFIIENGADPNGVLMNPYTRQLCTPLMCAAGNTKCPPEITKLLLTRKADPNKAAVRYGPTPLIYAIHALNVEVVAILLKGTSHGKADPNKSWDDVAISPLHDVTSNIYPGTEDKVFKICKLLLDNGAIADSVSEGDTPLSSIHEQLKKRGLKHGNKMKMRRIAELLKKAGTVQKRRSTSSQKSLLKNFFFN